MYVELNIVLFGFNDFITDVSTFEAIKKKQISFLNFRNNMFSRFQIHISIWNVLASGVGEIDIYVRLLHNGHVIS